MRYTPSAAQRGWSVGIRGARYFVPAGVHVDDERAVDFQCVYGKLRQVAERGEARAEIIDGYAEPHGADRVQARDVVFEVLHHHAFGDLQFPAPLSNITAARSTLRRTSPKRSSLQPVAKAASAAAAGSMRGGP
jgi:hypothetical protein